MRSTTTTRAERASSGRSYCSRSCDRPRPAGTSVVRMSSPHRIASGCDCASWRKTTSAAARACSAPTPGARRAIICSVVGARDTIQPSVAASIDRPRKAAGATPTIVYVRPSTVIAWPSASELAPKRSRHQASPTTATASSVASGTRPTAGWMPRSRKKLADTRASRRGGSTAPPIVTAGRSRYSNPTTAEKISGCARTASKAAGDAPVTAFLMPSLEMVCCTSTRRSGSLTGSDRRSSRSTRLKSAVLAPMPSASDTVAKTVNPRCFHSVRTAVRVSCQSRSIIRRTSARIRSTPSCRSGKSIGCCRNADSGTAGRSGALPRKHRRQGPRGAMTYPARGGCPCRPIVRAFGRSEPRG